MLNRSLAPQLETFEEDPRLHTKCGWHVQMLYYAQCIASVVVDLLGMLVGVLLLFHPHYLQQTAFYRQMLQHYDRTQAYQYQLFYSLAVLLWILAFFLHIAATGVAILGVQKRNPMLILPQLVLLVVRLGALLGLFGALVTIDLTAERAMIGATFIVALFTAASVSSLVFTVFCFRYVLEKYLILRRILASTKSVHFKEGKGKPRRK